ncbi:MAG: 30S ribosomal protein S1 [Candidatus Adiutrix sp.]|jgi:small subunit ribosomal protein S1|nr:30S ribosomal protein S1 [Candidatus Adiutrix sp.]
MENFSNHDSENIKEDLIDGLETEEPGQDERESADQVMTMDQFTEFEESFKSLSEGSLTRGEVVQIGKEYVMLDVKGKSEGRILLNEFLDADGNVTVKIGDEVEALVLRSDDEDGEIILSKAKAEKIKVWDDITRIHNEDGTIQGVITSRVKGGLSVDIGVNAFLPGSQVDSRPIKNLESLVGQTFDFKILKFNKRRGNVVLSHRAILEVAREAQKRETLATLEAGAVVEGVVKNLTEYGAFIDLGGLDGLLHVTDMSWGRLAHPSELFGVSDKVTVKVLAFDREKSRVSLGLKQLHEDPWITASQKYVVGEKITGRVVSLADYGAFVELDKGIEGLIHVSEMSWTRKVRNPASILKVGDIVDCVILKVDTGAKRISLGMKQVEPNPWDTVAERYPIGTIIEGKIKNITDFGVFIGIDEGIDGLVHISDISWTRRYKHPSEVFKKGDSVRALILAIDRDQERFSLGIKQLEEDPWSIAVARFPVGRTVSGKVTNITDFGLFVELAEGVEGLIHVSESGLPKGKPLSEAYKLGDEITAKVISISATDHKIGLSIKRLKKDDDDRLYKDYADSSRGGSGGGVSVLGEQLSKAFAAQQSRSDDDEN